MPPVIAALAAVIVEIGVSTAVATTIATVVVNLAVAVGLSLISSLLMGKPKEPSAHSTRANFRNPLAPRVRAYGRVKLGGSLACLKTAPTDPGGFNQLVVCVSHAQGQWAKQEEFWLADDKAFFGNGDATVTYPANYYWNKLPWVKIKGRIGSGTQTALDILMEGLPGIWTADFQGLNVPYTGTLFRSPKIEDFSNVYQAGLPAVSTVARASIVFDPRDPDQTLSSKSTWKWTANPIICLLDALWNEDGLALPFSMADDGIDVWKMEADYCDQWRATKDGGSEPWFRIAGAYQLTDPPKTWLPKMLEPIDARLVLRGDGAIVPSIGRWQEPELTISDNEIISYTGFSRGKPKSEVKNKIDATFIGPPYDYIQQQADPLLNEDSIDVDGEQSLTLDLDWCPSHPQARLRMKIEAARQDPQGWAGSIIAKVYGLKFLTPNSDGSPKRNIRIVLSELGIDDTFEVLRFAFDPKSGNCTFQVSGITAAAFDWDPAADEGTAPALPRNTANNGIENAFNLAVSVSGDVISSTFDAPLDTDLQFTLSTRLTADNVSDDEASWTEMTHDTWGGHTASLPDGRYDVRAILFSPAQDGILYRLFGIGGSPEPANYGDPRVIRGVVIGSGRYVGSPTSPPSFDAEDCGASTVQVTGEQAGDGTVVSLKVWAAAGWASVFGSAIELGEFAMQAGNGADLDAFIDVGATGHYNFWATTVDIFGTESSPIGPVAVNITGGTFAPPNAVPALPTGLVATPNSSTIDVSCDANPGGDSVTEYQFWGAQGTAGFGATKKLATVSGAGAPSTTLFFIDPDTSEQFVPGTDISLYVVAVNANGTSAPSDVVYTTMLSLTPYRSVDVATSSITLLDTDTWVDVNNTSGGPIDIHMPQHPVVGQKIAITDRLNTITGTNTWTIKPFGSATVIEVLDSAGAAHGSAWNGSVWKIGGGVS